jgi:hypothetical protein
MALSVFMFYGVIFQTSQVMVSDISSAIWRPLFTSAFMRWAITYLHNTGYGSHYASLAQDVSIGLVTFPLTLCILWFLSGRPDGVEKTMLTM